MKKVLFYCDSPTVITGFGNVARNIIAQIDKDKKYDIHICGINYYGEPHEYPYKIWPALNVTRGEQDVYGRNNFLNLVHQIQPEIVFILQDTFIVQSFIDKLFELREKQRFKIIYYFPIDAKPKKDWISYLEKIDHPIAYTNYAKKEVGLDIPVIYHGTDKNDFKPIDASEFRKVFFLDHHEDFIILNVNRNQPRKDLQKTFEGFSKLKKLINKSYLFILAQSNDVGGNLFELASHYGLEFGKDWSCPPPDLYNSATGVPVSMVNQFYNSCDVVLTTTLGEGWGLSVTEAMATRKPVLAPKHTSLVEMIGASEQRGTFIKQNGNTCLGPSDNSLVRPTVSTDDIASKLAHIAKCPEAYTKKIEAAYEWVPSWDEVGKQWIEIFDKAGKKE